MRAPNPRNMLLVAALGLASACGEAAHQAALAPLDPPQRTAAQDRALRALVMDVAAARACEELDRAFLPVPEERTAADPDVQPTIVGRLWVSECAVERSGEHLTMRVAGQGWQWIARSSPGPLGTSFTVRGQLRFQASVDLEAAVDLRYDEASHRAMIALTPVRPARARVTPIGSIPVQAEGGWSGIIGGLGTLLGSSIEDRARPLVEEHGAATLQRLLRGGATFALDLCTGQPDGTLGAVADGADVPARPYDDGEGLWADNARVALRRGAIDIAGPFASAGRRLVVDLEVESGGSVDAAIVCRDEAERLASEYLSGGVTREPRALARRTLAQGEPGQVALEPGACAEPVLFVRPSGEAEVRYRYRVRREGDEEEAWVRCPAAE